MPEKTPNQEIQPTPEVVSESPTSSLIPVKKRPPGAPPKYRSVFCQKIIEFFERKPYEDIELPHYKDGTVSWIDKKRVPRELPTLVSFSRSIGISYVTVHKWLNEKDKQFQKEFFVSFLRCKELQKDALIQPALMGLYNPIFAKFVAINLTDMKDTPLVDNSTHLHITHDYRKKNSRPTGAVRNNPRQGESSEQDAAVRS